jgi:Tn3 transposase DDE domain
MPRTCASLYAGDVGRESALVFAGGKTRTRIAEACKRLIKNCIICWNYLYLSQKLAEMDDPQRQEAILNALTHGSAVSWQHIKLLGEALAS